MGRCRSTGPLPATSHREQSEFGTPQYQCVCVHVVTRSLSLAIGVRLRPTFPDDAGSSGLGSGRQDRRRLSLLCPTSSNAGCLSEPLSSDVSVGLGKLGRVLERLVHLMSKTGAVEKTDQAEVGRTRAHVDLGAVPLMDDPDVRPFAATRIV